MVSDEGEQQRSSRLQKVLLAAGETPVSAGGAPARPPGPAGAEDGLAAPPRVCVPLAVGDGAPGVRTRDPGNPQDCSSHGGGESRRKGCPIYASTRTFDPSLPSLGVDGACPTA